MECCGDAANHALISDKKKFRAPLTASEWASTLSKTAIIAIETCQQHTDSEMKGGARLEGDLWYLY